MRSTMRHRSDVRADLETAPSGVRWDVLAAGAEGDRLGHLAGLMHADAERFVDRAVRRILKFVDGYEHTEIVERDDLWWSVYRNLEAVLIALTERRALDVEELALRRELGRRRAQQGMPIDDVMRAFRVGYAVLWEGLSEKAADLGSDYAQTLLEHAAHVWMTFDQVTSAVADAHREVVATQHLDRRRRSLTFLSGLERWPEDREATEQLARALGLDPSGPLLVAVARPGERSSSSGELVVVEQPDRVIVVARGSGEESRAEAAFAGQLRRLGLTHIGVGVMRSGLQGAHQALEDAEWAHRLALSADAPAMLFREGWLGCLALEHSSQLADLVGPAVKVLERDAELCATLEAFLSADGNLTATGKALFVHGNTVGYRLKQFALRTGVDPRTASGQALVQVALTYSQQTREETAPATVTVPGLTLA
jgi:DNA-binding PucR family transcriptional regulator